MNVKIIARTQMVDIPDAMCPDGILEADHEPETADYLCGMAAAMCTGSKNPMKALHTAIDCGHESVEEHANYTFQIDGVSRVLLAQITRHRLASFSVKGQRYNKVTADAEVIMPPKIKERPGAAEIFEKQVQGAIESYLALVESYAIEPEDARYMLPEGMTCTMIVTMNMRELRHFFELRMCNRAQWEIRNLADAMYKELASYAGDLMRHSGPKCVDGKCTEGKLCCGKNRCEEVLAMRLEAVK